MRDYTGLLEQFGDYASRYTEAGQKPSKKDIEAFMGRFFRQTRFNMSDTENWDSTTIMFYGARWTDPKTGEHIFDTSDDKYIPEYIDEVRPILHEAFHKEHGKFGTPMDYFNPAPIIPITETEKIQHEAIKEFTMAYNRKTLPFRLRKTMHHSLRMVWFSKSAHEVKASGKAGQIVMRSDEDIEEFLNTKTYKGVVAGMHAGLKSVMFIPSPTGEYPKFGIIDLDNPADVDFKEFKKIVYDIAKEVDKIHNTIVQFSGRGFQIWFSASPMKFDSVQEMRDYGKDMVRKITKHAALTREDAIEEGLPFAELKMGKGSAAEMFFGIHYKLGKSLNESSGLARVPVEIKDIRKFEPEKSAHPIHVLKNFDKLKAPVDAWFLSVGIGDGFSDLEAPPPCYRTPTGKADKEHPLALALQDWKYKPRPKPILYSKVGVELFQYPELIITPKYDGWASVISYNRQGGFKVNGKQIDSQKKQGKRISMDTNRSIIASKGGVMAWDNYLTREFERMCKKAGFDELTVVAELIQIDSFGVVMGNLAVQSIMLKQANDDPPQHDEEKMRSLKAVIVDVLSIDKEKVQSKPFLERIRRVMDLDGERVRVVDPFVITDDYQEQFDKIWKDQTLRKKNEGLFVYAGGKRFKVKYLYTLDAVVMGINIGKTNKAWRDKKKHLGSLVLGVSKETKKGLTFFPIGKVGGGWTDKQSAELFDMLLGQPTKETYGFFENIWEYQPLQEAYPDVKMLKPESWIVVEVSFKSLSPRRKPLIGPAMYRFQERKGMTRRGSQIDYLSRIYYNRALLGPPTYIGLRPDKDPFIPDDVSYKQGEMAGGFEISIAKPNPTEEFTGFNKPWDTSRSKLVSKSGRTHVLPNPQYGWNAGPRWVSGGTALIDFSAPPHSIEGGTIQDSTPIGHKPLKDAGKSHEDKWLTLTKEFKNQLTKTDDQWGLHYDPKQLKYPKNRNGIHYYLDIPGFPVGSEDGVFDIEGPNIGGVVHDVKREESDYQDQLIMDYKTDKQQALRDQKIVLGSNFLNKQTFPVPIAELGTDEFDKRFFETQDAQIGSRMGVGKRKGIGKSQEMKELLSGRVSSMGIQARENPEETEESIEKAPLPKPAAGFISPFDAFIVMDGEEE